jgi:hypothetical protein
MCESYATYIGTYVPTLGITMDVPEIATAVRIQPKV